AAAAGKTCLRAPYYYYTQQHFCSCLQQRSESFIPKPTKLLVTLFTLFIIVEYRLMNPTKLSFTSVKIMLSFSLIYFFYQGMALLFPTSQALGPMFLNLTTMMKRDLFRWLRIWILTLISGAISIHAVLYPAYPLNLNAISKAFLRGFMGLFVTDVSDLSGAIPSNLGNHPVRADIAKKKLEKCPHTSVGGYFVVLLYLFETKLVYYVLIFAICSVTMANTYAKSVEIWKYQFFVLVQEYSQRFLLPAPFVIIHYPFYMIHVLYLIIRRLAQKSCECCKPQESETKEEEYNMWRNYMKTFGKREKLEKDRQNVTKSTEQRLSDLRRQQTTFRRVITNLNNRLIQLLNAQTSESLMMEQLKETVEALRVDKTNTDLPQSLHHRQCRLSPYPGTNIRRFAVFDKNVSWEEAYPSYDPPVYTKPIAEFDEAIRPFVDFDVFDLMRLRGEQERLDVMELAESEPVPEFKPEYNTVQEATTLTGETFTMDRTSWIRKDKQQISYIVDITGVPRNPMGRTGLRGRGNLWRWGPNHASAGVQARVQRGAGGDHPYWGDLHYGQDLVDPQGQAADQLHRGHHGSTQKPDGAHGSPRAR
ncbi:hypothetical protein EGW08_000674, partial [Elysia chlorotica]